MMLVVRFRRGDTEGEEYFELREDGIVSSGAGTSILAVLQSLEGAEIASVVTKVTREELRGEWQSMVRMGRTEKSLSEWIETVARQSPTDPGY